MLRLLRVVLNFLSDFSYRACIAFCVLGLSVMLIIIIAQVICRYLLGFSIIWSEEVARYSLITISYIGLSVLIKRDEMMSIRILVNRVPRIPSLILQGVADAISVTFLLILVIYGIKMVGHTWSQLTIITQFPIALVYASIPVGSAFYILHLITNYINRVQG